MGRRKKSVGRELADFVADYGVLPGPLTYAQYVGMVLNQPRARLRKVYYDALATAISGTDDEIPFPVVRAVCDTDSEARKLSFVIQAARARAKKGF